MSKPTHILIVEDLDADFELAQLEIRKSVKDCLFERVETRQSFLDVLETFQPDVILSDYSLPRFDGMTALKLAKAQAPLTPFIMWTGSISEEVAADCMKAGANNYIIKENIERLGPAVVHALDERQLLLERKAADDNLRKSESKYRALTENSLQGIAIFQNSRMVYANPAICAIMGYTAEELIEMSEDQIIALTHPDDRAIAQERTRKRRAGESVSASNDLRIIRKDSTIRWIQTFSNLIEYNGQPAVLSTSIDITERRQAEQKYQDIFENSQEGIFQSTPNGRFIRVNPAMARIYGYASPEEMIESITNIADQIYLSPEDRKEFTHQLQSRDHIEHFEMKNLRKDGSIIWTSTSARIVRDDGNNILYYEGFLQDVTERKQAEENLHTQEKRFRSLIENSLDNISLLAADGTLLWENPAVNRTLGYQQGEFVQRNIFELMHPDDVAWTGNLFSRVTQEPGSQQRGTFRLKHLDGTWRWIEATATNMLNEPSVNATVINYRDITERKQAELELQDARELFQKSFHLNPVATTLSSIAERTIIDVNTATETLFGYSRAELVGKPSTGFDYWVDARERQEAFDTLLQHEHIANYEFAFRKKSGEVGRAILSAEIIEQHGDKFILTTYIDITDRKRAETELRQKNDDLRLINAINEAAVHGSSLDEIVNMMAKEMKRFFSSEGSTVYMLSPDGMSLAMQQYALSPEIRRQIEKVIGSTIPLIHIPIQEGGFFQKILSQTQGVVTSDPKEIQKWMGEFVETNFLPAVARGALRKLIPQIYKILNIKSVITIPLVSDGKTIGIMDVSSPNLFTNEDLGRIEAISRQLTAAIQRQQADKKIQRSEAFLQSVQNALSASIAILNEEGTIVQVNSAWRKFGEQNGLKHPEYCIGLNYLEVCDTAAGPYAEDAPVVANAIREVIAGQKREAQIEYSCHSPEEKRWFILHITKFEDEDQVWVVLSHENITERKQAEESFRETSEQFRTLFEASPEAIMLLDPQGEWKILDCNSMACSMNGFTREGLVGQSVDVINLTPGKPNERAEYLERIRKAGILRYETTHRRKDGSEFPVEVSTSLITFGGREVILGIDRDITERKQAEEALRTSEALYRQAMEVAGAVPYYESYYDGGKKIKYEFIGEGIRQITGYGPDEFSAKLWDSLVEEVNLIEDLQGYTLEEGIQRVRSGENSIWKCEHRIRARDGKIHWVFEAAVELRDEHGVSHGSIGTYQDITAHKIAEEEVRKANEKYRNIFENAMESIHQTTPDGRYLTANPATARILGYETPEELMANTTDLDRQFYVNANRRAEFKTLMEEYGFVSGFESEVYRKDGSTIWVSENVRAIRDEQGNLLYYEGTSQDITERKRAEEAERDQRALAEALRNTAEILNSTLDYGEVLDRILITVRSVVPHDASSIMLIEQDRAHVARMQGYAEHDLDRDIKLIEFPLAETSNLKQMFETGRPMVVSDTRSYPGWKETPATEWFRSSVGAPISIFGEVVGFILLDSAIPGFFTPVHGERLEAFANQAALAIHNARLLQQAQEEITERKQAEEALRKSEQRYRALFEDMPIAIWEEDFSEVKKYVDSLKEQGVSDFPAYFTSHPAATIECASKISILNTNKAALRMYRVDNKQDLISGTIHELTKGELEHIHEDFIAVAEGRIGHGWEGSDETLTGEPIEISLSWSVVPGYENDYSKIIVTTTDITDRKQAEKALRESEEKYRLLFDSNPLPMWIYDHETLRFLKVNDAAIDHYGYSEQEFRSMTIKDIRPSADVPKLIENISQVARGIDRAGVWNHIKKDGSLIEVEIISHVVEFDGRLSELVLANDVTERRRAENELRASEERFRQLADNIQEVFWMTDAISGEEIYISLASEKIWGRSIDNMLQSPDVFIESVLPEDRPTVLQKIKEQRSGEKTDMEYRILHPDGSIRWVWDRAFPIFDNAGRVVRLAGIAADITERKQVQEALHNSEKRYRGLFENLVIGFALHEIVLDDKGKPVDYVFLEINPMFEKLTGIIAQKAIGRRVTEVLPDIENDRFIEIYGKVALTREPVHIEEFSQDLGKYYEINVYSPRQGQFAVTFIDTTERKQAENALRESEVRFSGVVNSAMDAVISVDTNQRILLFNPAAEKMFGCSAKETIGQSIERFIPSPHRPQHQGNLLRFGRTGETSRAMGHLGSLSGVRSDGTEFPIEASISHIEVGGEHLYTVIMRDITERKQAEEQLRKLSRAVDQSASTIVITDTRGNIEYVNSKFTETTGYTAAEAIGQNPRILKSTHTSPEEYDQLWKTILSGEDWHGEFINKRKNGEFFWESATISPIVNDHGETTHFLAVKEDITERKQAEEALRKNEQRLRIALAGTNIAVFNQDVDLRYIWMYQPQLGYTSAEVVGRTDAELLPTQDALSIMAIKRRAMATGKPQRAEISIHSADRTNYYDLIVEPLLDSNSTIIGITGSTLDITDHKDFEIESRRHLAELEALYENGLAVGRLLNPREIGERIIETFARHLSWHHVAIRLRQPESDNLELIAFNLPGLSDEEKNNIEQRLKSMVNKVGRGLSGFTVQTGEPFRTGNVHAHAQYVDTHIGIQSGLYMPLKVGEKVIGVISVESEAANAFTAQDERLLATLASQAAVAFENAYLYQSIQQERERFSELFENSPIATWLEDFSQAITWMNGLRMQGITNLKEHLENNPKEYTVGVKLIRILDVNHTAVVMNGARNKEELIERVHELMLDETPSQVMINELELIWRGYTSFGFEMSSLKLDGSLVTGIQRVYIPTSNNEPDYTRVIVTSTDITERVNFEKQLRNSEVHYRELADSITDIFFELDQDLHYSHWNKASELLTGLSAEYAIGKSMRDVFGESDEQTRIGQIYGEVLEKHLPRTFETVLPLNGLPRDFEINAYPSTRGVAVVAKDVTERKRTESLMQKRFELMEYSAEHTLEELMRKTLDEISQWTHSTIGFFQFMGEDQATPTMQIWSTDTFENFRSSDGEIMHKPVDQAGVWAEAVHQKQAVIHNDYASMPGKKGLPEGHTPLIRELVVPIIRSEKVVAVIGIGNKPQEYTRDDLEIMERFADYAWDVTERKQMVLELAEERNQLAKRVEERTADLSRANSNLARALRVKDEFLANMSHELRTPLNAILGLSESLAEQIAGPLNDKQLKYTTTISESGHHLLSLINDILDLAKIEAGQITLDINKVDVNSVSQASLRMIKQLAQKKNLDVAVEIDKKIGLMWADERRLKQMIVNLLSNAVKFTPENGKLGLKIEGQPDENKVVITVWDTGIGIKENDFQRLFQPFVQLDSGLARESTGTGLGLALVAQMARMHGGSVNVTSDPGKGSRFTIVLPWEPALVMDAAERLKVTGKFRPVKPGQEQQTILLVEDTQEVVMMIRDYLEIAGYKVVTALDGIDGVTQAKLAHPDLILMDVQMPRMDGLEATQKLRQEAEFKYTPIIALTALAMPNDRERCLAAGMDEYISKPVNLRALVKIIQASLSTREEKTQPR